MPSGERARAASLDTLVRAVPGLAEELTERALAVVQVEVAWIVTRSADPQYHLLGFTLAIYGSGCVLVARPRWTVALVAVSWAALGLFSISAGAGLSAAELLAVSVYLATASLIAVLAHLRRHALTTRELTTRESSCEPLRPFRSCGPPGDRDPSLRPARRPGATACRHGVAGWAPRERSSAGLPFPRGSAEHQSTARAPIRKRSHDQRSRRRPPGRAERGRGVAGRHRRRGQRAGRGGPRRGDLRAPLRGRVRGGVRGRAR